MLRIHLRRALSLGVSFGHSLILILVLTLMSCSPAVIGEQTIDMFNPQALRFSGRPLQMLAQVEARGVRDGWTPELLDTAGDLWREAGDLTRALPFWEQAAQLAPTASRYRTLATTYLEIHHWDRALDALNRLSSFDQTDADRRWAALQRGLIRAIADPVRAREDLLLARQEPAYAETVDIILGGLDAEPSTRLRTALAFGEAGLWGLAELSLEQASAGEGLDVIGYARMRAYLALARASQGRDAIEQLRYAVELAPQDAQTRTFEGLYWRARGDLPASRDAFQAAVALDPENPSLYAELAAALELLGDSAQARFWLERAVAFSGGDPRYQALLDALPPAD